MRLLYDTSSPGKIMHMKEILRGLNLEIVGLKDIGIDVHESGNHPLKNTKIKALEIFL